MVKMKARPKLWSIFLTVANLRMRGLTKGATSSTYILKYNFKALGATGYSVPSLVVVWKTNYSSSMAMMNNIGDNRSHC
jgi:hypothetical protein